MEHVVNQPEDIKPLAPHEILREKQRYIPPQVIQIVNRLLAERGAEGYVNIKQHEIIDELERQGFDRAVIFERHWLDFEDLYREAGWHVTYDKPVYYAGEDFPAYFEFSINDY